MRQIILVCLGVIAGCQSTRSNLGYPPPGRADDPLYSIDEQQRRGRDRYTYVEDSAGVAPKTYVDRPGTTGR